MLSERKPLTNFKSQLVSKSLTCFRKKNRLLLLKVLPWIFPVFVEILSENGGSETKPLE